MFGLNDAPAMIYDIDWNTTTVSLPDDICNTSIFCLTKTLALTSSVMTSIT